MGLRLPSLSFLGLRCLPLLFLALVLWQSPLVHPQSVLTDAEIEEFLQGFLKVIGPETEDEDGAEKEDGEKVPVSRPDISKPTETDVRLKPADKKKDSRGRISVEAEEDETSERGQDRPKKVKKVKPPKPTKKPKEKTTKAPKKEKERPPKPTKKPKEKRPKATKKPKVKIPKPTKKPGGKKTERIREESFSPYEEKDHYELPEKPLVPPPSKEEKLHHTPDVSRTDSGYEDKKKYHPYEEEDEKVYDVTHTEEPWRPREPAKEEREKEDLWVETTESKIYESPMEPEEPDREDWRSGSHSRKPEEPEPPTEDYNEQIENEENEDCMSA